MQHSALYKCSPPAFSLSEAGAFGTRIQVASMATAFGLLDQMHMHHPATAAHSVRVARLTMAMWSVAPTWVGPYETAMLGALLHDTGKLCVPREILESDSPLTPDQLVMIRDHPRCGALVLERAGFAEAVVEAAQDHHERWVGGGYPSARPSTQMSPLARAIATADSFSAMIEPGRAYRLSLSVPEALKELDVCSGKQFDPTTVALLRAGMDHWHEQVPVTCIAELQSDEAAHSTDQEHSARCCAPVFP